MKELRKRSNFHRGDLGARKQHSYASPREREYEAKEEHRPNHATVFTRPIGLNVRFSFLAALLLSGVLYAQQPVTWSGTTVLESDPSSWARMTQLTDGSWLAAYMYATTPNRIRLKRSFDRMRTWQFVTEITEDGRDLDNPALCVLPDGTVELAIRSVIVGQSYWIETYRSTDSGNSFTYQSQVDWDHRVQGVFEPYLYVLPGGQLACFYTNDSHQRDTPPYSQVLSEKVSSDGGATWGEEIFAVAQPGAARPGEANVVPLPGNVFALFYEMCGSENCLGHVSYSTDGMNWAGIGPVIPGTFQDVQVVDMGGGLIIATSNLKDIVVSTDYTNTWIDTHQSVFTYGSWPAIYRTGPTEFAVVMTGAGDQGQAGEYIRFGNINAAALQNTSASGFCRGPSTNRPQICR